MKRLIVTADDFGLSRELNTAVIEAYQKGILRFASLMVKAPFCEDAVEKAKQNPGLGVGLHLELCHENPGLWGLRYFFLPSDRKKIEPEIASQIEKFLSFGLTPSHIDAHFNINVHPTIFPVMARVARHYRIPRVRLPVGEWRLSRMFDKTGLLKKSLTAGIFETLAFFLKSNARKNERVVCDQTFGLLRSGLMNEAYFLWLFEHFPEGLSEIYCHPSADPSSFVTDEPTRTHHSVTELEALTSLKVLSTLKKSEIQLVLKDDIRFGV